MAGKFDVLWMLRSGIAVDEQIASIEQDARLSRSGKDRRIAKLQRERQELVEGLEAGRGNFSLPVDRQEFNAGRRR